MYGYPPDPSECVEAEAPPNLKVKADQTVLTPLAHTMSPHIGAKASVAAVARQLNQHYDFGREKCVSVAVPGYGTFFIGPEGWECV